VATRPPEPLGSRARSRLPGPIPSTDETPPAEKEFETELAVPMAGRVPEAKVGELKPIQYLHRHQAQRPKPTSCCATPMAFSLGLALADPLLSGGLRTSVRDSL